MEKISENKFWQDFISEFYTQGQINQESYNCLNAFLECPEIIEMLNGCELSSEECKQYRAAILDVLSKKIQSDKNFQIGIKKQKSICLMKKRS